MSARRSPSRARAAVFGVVGSLIVHAAGLLGVGALAVPDPGFSLRLPDEVEFGLAEEVEASLPAAAETAAPPAPAAPEPPAPEPPPEPEPAEEPPPAPEDDAADAGPAAPPDAGSTGDDAPDGGVPDLDGLDAGPLAADALDAGVPDDGAARDGAPADAGPDGSVQPDAGEPPDGGAPEGERSSDGGPGDAGPVDAGRGDRGQGIAAAAPPPRRYRLPAGAQLALRLDLARIRGLELAGDATVLLASLPDWRALLEGSGVEPVRDLDRLMIATPTLRRSRTLVAGRVVDGPDRVREAVRTLAEHRGAAAEWSTRDGVPVAPWHDRDSTERIAALLGGRAFSITRPEDLPRLLAVARARGDAAAEPGDAILSMPPDALVTFEAEGARAYAQGPLVTRVPTSLRATLAPADEDTYALEIVGEYPETSEAEEAEAYLAEVVGRLAANPLAAAFGLAGPLSRARITRDGGTLTLATQLRAVELRALLRTGAQALGGPAPPRPRPE